MTPVVGHEVPPYSSTRLTAHLGLLLSLLLALLFVSGGAFYLYAFNFNVPPWFTLVRVAHFYTGLASIPILLAKYGSTSVRFLGYYLRVSRFRAAGPPAFVPRLLSPLLALDFFVLYGSGLYMLFHYYYTVTNIWPFEATPVQVHMWAAIVGVPLVTTHLVWHLASALRSVRAGVPVPVPIEVYAERPPARLARRAFLGGLIGIGGGLAFAFQNTRARSWEFANLFIGRIPEEERGGPGDFPVEILFGKARVTDIEAYRLTIVGEVDAPLSLSYRDLLALPSAERTIRLSCVSGWTQRVRWRGPLVREVLAQAREREGTRSVAFHSLSDYGVTWHRDRLDGDDAILATHANGAPLSENHGFPVRLIVAGYPGQQMVKQLDRIFVRLEAEEFHPDFRLVSATAGGTPPPGEVRLA